MTMPEADTYPLISIITLNWNTTDVTCEFLRSIREQNNYPRIEVIVVDNASSEDPTAAFLTAYPDAIVVRNEANLGFSAGNNAGIRAAKGEYLFIVNNDTEFTPGLLEGLLKIFRTYPDAGMASPKFHYFFEKGTIEYAGYEQVNILTGRNGMVGCREKDEGQYDEVRPTHYVHGGGMMVPRRVVDEVGLMPEIFFLYYEELDWSEQIKRKGYSIYYQPASLIYHKESMTTGRSSPLKTFYLTRNRILFMRRNVAWPAFLVFTTYFLFFTMPKNTLSYLVRGQSAHLKSFWKGVLWQFNSKISFK
ncbi:glycosyltransferase family 2 protein [Flavitalea sp. BT771]|uniref:glycosyltransferase family 2 protein n=1 Tax=Flavitalea sp. BT771 TaxID=3063329 RepID=UPI0026E1E832|nr:glycosyltransferase family 2 protein [Flavitalea sp. BT771]MDV6223944.1 glycosyltransferase family 2 protein [Flavitalea sp. BT771]